MKIAMLASNIVFNGCYTWMHDLLANIIPTSGSAHRVYLINPIWERDLVYKLQRRGIETRSCFAEFQDSHDVWWNKIKDDCQDCDVIVSANIENLDEVLHPEFNKPIVSVSLSENGYKTTNGGYGSHYKDRFELAAVSEAAVLSFPEHVRDRVEVIYSGIDSERVSQHTPRLTLRETWFPGRSNDVKLVMFTGKHQDSKRLDKLMAAFEFLPPEYHLLVMSKEGIDDFPEFLSNRIHRVKPTYFVGDIFRACDIFVLPTEHEGLSMSLLEAWSLKVPTVTTRHKTMLELQNRHTDTDFGQLVDVDCSPKDIAEAILETKASESAQQVIHQCYTAKQMADNWSTYFEEVINNYGK